MLTLFSIPVPFVLGQIFVQNVLYRLQFRLTDRSFTTLQLLQPGIMSYLIFLVVGVSCGPLFGCRFIVSGLLAKKVWFPPLLIKMALTQSDQTECDTGSKFGENQ